MSAIGGDSCATCSQCVSFICRLQVSSFPAPSLEHRHKWNSFGWGCYFRSCSVFPSSPTFTASYDWDQRGSGRNWGAREWRAPSRLSSSGTYRRWEEFSSSWPSLVKNKKQGLLIASPQIMWPLCSLTSSTGAGSMVCYTKLWLSLCLFDFKCRFFCGFYLDQYFCWLIFYKQRYINLY